MDCPNCQRPLAQGARFCTSCGHAVAAAASGDAEGTTVMEAVTEAVTTDGPTPATGRDGTTASSAPPQGSLVRCSACGAENSAARVLCARCGVDLESGVRPVAAPVVHRPGPAVDVAGEVTTDEGRGNRTALVVAVIIVLGAIVGVLVGLWVVDAGRTPEPTAPVFDPGVYTGEPEALGVTGVGASSERPPAGEATYDAGNLVDGDITTAWSHDPSVEAAQDVDLAFALAEPAWVTALTFANGAQSEDLAFTADGRILRLMLLADRAAVAELQLLDQPGLQRVRLPEPVLLDTLRLVVLEAVPGDTYDEVSLSEVVIIGHPAQGDDLARMVADADSATE